MTMAELRKAAEWLSVLDQAIDWKESFATDNEAKAKPFIEFADIAGHSQADGMGEARGWDGGLMVPRNVAIDMMDTLAKRARDELKKLGVKP